MHTTEAVTHVPPPSHAASPPERSRGLRVGGLLQVTAALLWAPQAALIALAVNRVAMADFTTPVWPLGVGILVLGLIRAGLDAVGTRKAFLAARSKVTQLRQEATQALARTSPLAAHRTASGLAASLLAEQADAILPYHARFQPARLKASLVPPVLLVLVASLSWVAALILLLAAPLIPLFMALVGWQAKAASTAQLAEMGDMNAFLLDRLRGLATIRTLSAVDATALRLRANAENLRIRTLAVLRIAFLSSAVLELFSALGVAMVAVYVGFHLLGHLGFGAWGSRLSLGEGLFVLMLAPAFFDPLRELSAAWHDRAAGQAAEEALRRLAQVPLALPGADATADPAPRASGPPEIKVTQLGFHHAGGEGVFERLDFTVRAGERVALTGVSGRGKSTLLALLAGLAPVTTGVIQIGGTPLNAHTAAALRARMAWIGQKPHLFAASFEANITMGRADISPAAVRQAIRLAALEPVRAAHGGVIGEGGIGLSGGEAMRLALARAAAPPGADLILADEPTAHLDRATARQVREGLLALAAGRTLIIATHDLELAAAMDRIIDLDRLDTAASGLEPDPIRLNQPDR